MDLADLVDKAVVCGSFVVERVSWESVADDGCVCPVVSRNKLCQVC